LWAWLRRKSISDEPQSHAPKPLLRDSGPPRRKKTTHNQKGSPKQVELEPKLNAFLDTAKLASPMVEMNKSPKKRNLRVVKWLSSTPVVAVCTFCSREFKVPMSALSRTVDAQANLQQQFDRHTCQPEDAT
jgi:hypothetical protein